MIKVISEEGKFFLRGEFSGGIVKKEISAADASKMIAALDKGDGKAVKIKPGLVIEAPLRNDTCVKFIFSGKVKGYSCENRSLVRKLLKKVK